MNNIFIPLPKSSKAVRCEDHRTISLISHTAKIVLTLIKKRIAPIIEQQLSDNQYGFRAGRGTRDAICQLRIIQFNSIQFSLFPAHINISYNIDNVHIMCRKRGGLKTVLMNVHPQTLTVVNYEHNYYCL